MSFFIHLVLKAPRASGLMQKSSLVFAWSLLKKGPKNIFRHGLAQQWANLHQPWRIILRYYRVYMAFCEVPTLVF